MNENSRGLFTAGEFADMAGADIGEGAAESAITRIVIDSREVTPGSLFVALEGENTDGHRFVGDAFERGAAAALVCEEKVESDARKGSGGVLIKAADPLKALGEAARRHRQRYQIPVIGVTGSVGKTTCKDMIASVLGRKSPTLKSRGNYNTEIGVPLTLFELTAEYEFVVLELAMRKKGDLTYLSGIARPTVGVLTRIAASHMEFLGSQGNIARAKSELFATVSRSGWAVLNADDRWSRWMTGRTEARVAFYGAARQRSEYRDLPPHEVLVTADHVSLDELGRPQFVICFSRDEKIVTKLQVAGRHQVENALAAAAVGQLMGVSPTDVGDGLATVNYTDMRMQWIECDDFLILNDTYNSSPTSCSAALSTLAACQVGRRKIAVLGDMLELGDRERDDHLKMGREVARMGIDVLVCVGKLARWMAQGAVRAGMDPGRCRHYPDVEDLLADITRVVKEGDVVLVKASRGLRLERCTEVLRNEFCGVRTDGENLS